MLYRIMISLYINFLELLSSGYSIDLQNLNEWPQLSSKIIRFLSMRRKGKPNIIGILRPNIIDSTSLRNKHAGRQ